jgi:hypothetical protein
MSTTITSNQRIVKYYGRSNYVDSNDESLQTIRKEVNDICSLVDNKKNDKRWKSLSDDLTNLEISLHASSSSQQHLEIKQYQLDIINDSIIPYIRELNTRITIEPSRYDQLKNLLDILLHNNDANDQETNHPAHILCKIELLIDDVDRNSGFGIWKSSLAGSLRRAVKKQWDPILKDTQKALHFVGSKLLMLGVVEVIGRPLIMLYPLYVISTDCLQVISDMNLQQEELTMRTISQIPPGKFLLIVKAFMLLWASFQVITILSMFNSIGYSCLIIGSLSLFLSVSDERTKQVAPFLSMHLKHVDKVIDFLSVIENKMMNSFNTNIIRNSINNNNNNNNNNDNSNDNNNNNSSNDNSNSGPIIEEVDDAGNVINHDENISKSNELRQRKKKSNV